MDEEHIEHPTHGVLQMQDFLFALGMHVNEKRVRRLFKADGYYGAVSTAESKQIGEG